MKNLMVLVLLLCCGSVWATPVVWELRNVVFDDGGIATGSFTYDADTNQFSNIEVATSDGITPIFVDSDGETDYYEIFPGESYISGVWAEFNPGRYNFYTQPIPDTESPYTLALRFSGELEDDLSTYSILTGFGESTYDFERGIVSGYVAAVPIPAAVWLFGSGLGLLGWMKRKRA